MFIITFTETDTDNSRIPEERRTEEEQEQGLDSPEEELEGREARWRIRESRRGPRWRR